MTAAWPIRGMYRRRSRTIATTRCSVCRRRRSGWRDGRAGAAWRGIGDDERQIPAGRELLGSGRRAAYVGAVRRGGGTRGDGADAGGGARLLPCVRVRAFVREGAACTGPPGAAWGAKRSVVHR